MSICTLKVHVIAGVYRLWKCTGSELDDLGIASIHEDYNGGRDFWFERIHLGDRVCVFQEDHDGGVAMNLTFGTIPYDSHVRKQSRTRSTVVWLRLWEAQRFLVHT